MKNLYYKHLFLSIMLVVVLQSKSMAQGFEQLPSGISYAVLKTAGTGNKIAYDKFVNFHIEVKTDLGKILESSFVSKSPKKFVPIKPKQFDGDPSEIFPFLEKGDSAVCKVPIELLAKRFGGNIQQIVGNSKFMIYTFKILEVFSKEELDIAKKQEEAKQREKFEAQKNIDDKKIQDYLKKNNLQAQKTASGLYYIAKKKGTGEPTVVGENVKVHYIGTLLNGNMFDTSREDVAKANNLYNPNRDYSGLDFMLGKGQVIKGWDEGVLLMSQGDQYLLFIPSYLAYGSRARGANIPANSILIFDVEVL